MSDTVYGKAQLIRALSKSCPYLRATDKKGLRDYYAREVVDFVLLCLMKALSRGEKIVLRGFGTFQPVLRGGYVVRSPLLARGKAGKAGTAGPEDGGSPLWFPEHTSAAGGAGGGGPLPEGAVMARRKRSVRFSPSDSLVEYLNGKS